MTLHPRDLWDFDDPRGSEKRFTEALLSVSVEMRTADTGKIARAGSVSFHENTDEGWARAVRWLVKNRLTPQGERLEDQSFLLLFNGHHEAVTFTLPSRRWGQEWELELCTGDPEAERAAFARDAREDLEVVARSVTVLRRVSPARG